MPYHIALSNSTPHTYRVINSDTLEVVSPDLPISEALSALTNKKVEEAQFVGLLGFTVTVNGEVAR